MKKIIIIGISLCLFACVAQAQEEKIELEITEKGAFFTEIRPQKMQTPEATTVGIKPEEIPSNCDRIVKVTNTLGEAIWQCQQLINGKYVSLNESFENVSSNQRRTIVIWPYGDDMFQNQELIDGVWTDVGAPF